jgi:hypothetical protein
MIFPGDFDGGGAGIDFNRLELFMQAQLLAQRLAQWIIVIHQENFLTDHSHHEQRPSVFFSL